MNPSLHYVQEVSLEDVDTFHERGVFLPLRTIYAGSEQSSDDDSESGLDARFAERLIKNLFLLEAISDEPISIVLNTIGGSIQHGLAIYDAITQCPCHVTITVRGAAHSMGAIILQAADDRVIGPSASLLLHYGIFGGQGTYTDSKRSAKHNDTLAKTLENVLLQRIAEKHEVDLAYVIGLLQHDTYLTAQEALELGLVDRIG